MAHDVLERDVVDVCDFAQHKTLGERLGHVFGGYAVYAADQVAHQQPRPALMDYLASSQFWFESFQNWQSEFLAIASMVWLAVYLRQRRSPESKPVHAPHHETGR